MSGDAAMDPGPASLRGAIQVRRIAPGLVLTKMRGHATVEHLPPIAEAIASEIEAGVPPKVFHDWEQMTGYDTAARIAMTKWYREVRDRVDSVHVLASSSLVAMGVAVVALAVGARVQSYSSRKSFEEALASATSLVKRID